MHVPCPSYGLIQGLTGVRYDAVEKILYIDSKIGNDFRSFLSTETGFGTVGLENGKPYLTVKMGGIMVNRCIVAGVEKEFDIKSESATEEIRKLCQ